VAIWTNLYPEKSFAGKVTYISDIIDPKLRTAKIRVEVDNAEGLLKPNMYIQGLVESQGKGRRLILVPEAALQTLNGEKIVFLRREEDEFILRHVKPGEKAGENRIILEGLREGETVVVGGAFSLKAELGKDSRGHDHAH
jgi:multidrug efflux pump subunit AcrA (membrane-fusion protein)